MSQTFLRLAALAAAAAGGAPATGDAPEAALLRISSGEVTGQKTFEVHVRDGDVRVLVDGKELHAARIEKRDGRLFIVDDQGSEHPIPGVALEDDGAWAWAFATGTGEPAKTPGVMLGVRLADPPRALEKHLNLEPGTTTMIEALHEGLPAHTAGLDQYDIVTAIDGRTPADRASLMKVLATKEPGDTVKLQVIQSGKAHTVEVRLEAYDLNRMKDAPLIGAPALEDLDWPGLRSFTLPDASGPLFRGFLFDPADPRRFFRWERDPQQWRELFEDQMRRFREADPHAGAPPARPEIEQQLDRLEDRLRELQERLDRLVQEKRQD